MGRVLVVDNQEDDNASNFFNLTADLLNLTAPLQAGSDEESADYANLTAPLAGEDSDIYPVDTRIMMVTAIVLKISGLLSLLGSGWIVLEICADRQKWKMTYHRLLLGLSVTDFFSAAGFGLSSWPVPRGYWWGAAGNARTCTMQGVFIHTFHMEAMYNVSLSLYYLVVIKYSWKQDKIRRRLEPYLHAVTWVVGIATMIPGLVFGLFVPSGPVCAMTFYTLATFLPVIILWSAALIVATLSMMTIYRSIRNVEDKMERYGMRAQMRQLQGGGGQGRQQGQGVNRKSSKEFAVQGLMFVGAFLGTFSVQLINLILQYVNVPYPEPILYLVSIIFPLQGLWDFLIYLRPRYKEYRKKYPQLSRCQVVGKVLQKPFGKCQRCQRCFRIFFCFPCCFNKNGNSNEHEDDEDDNGRDARLVALAEGPHSTITTTITANV